MRSVNWELISVWLGVFTSGCAAWWAFFKLAAFVIRQVIGG